MFFYVLCYVVNKPSEQEQTSAKVNCEIRIRLL